MTISSNAQHSGAGPAPKTVRGTDGPDRLVGTAGEPNRLYGLGGDDTLIGADRDDLVVDGGGDDLVRAGAGADTIRTGGGDDTVLAGDGDDLVVLGGQGLDSVDGGGGDDTLAFAAGTRNAAVDLSTGNLSTLSRDGFIALGTARSVENVVGTVGDDSLSGDDRRNVLDGGDGDDLVEGGAGADLLVGGAGDDTLGYTESASGVSVDLSTGAASGGDAAGDALDGFENLVGSSSADRLAGDAGANALTGGFGGDLLTGGAGPDRFVFERLTDSTAGPGGRDRIRDFGEGDLIDLSAIDPVFDTFADEAFVFRGSRAFTGAEGELRVVLSENATLVLADADGDRTADLSIRLDGRIALQADDFVL